VTVVGANREDHEVFEVTPSSGAELVEDGIW